ncbi:hypothetical protein LCGC14_2404700 [marine sediment metagenome]|uniref:Uncharacterized protein n=1 Tax=marine sediment metagenome TaxID=412755 RepID=A0A0F9CGC4_9ZZZZ
MPKKNGKRTKTYPLNTIKITPLNPNDSATAIRIAIIATSIKPDKRAANAKEHQARIYDLTRRLTKALDKVGIKYQAEPMTGRSSRRDRLNFNDNVVETNNA